MPTTFTKFLPLESLPEFSYIRYRNRNLSKTNPFHRFDNLVEMDRRSIDARWELALADASARKGKWVSARQSDKNREIENLEINSTGIQASPLIVLEAECDALSRKLSAAQLEKISLQFKVEKLENKIMQLETSRADLLVRVQNHVTSAESEEPEEDVDLSDEIVRYHRLLEGGEKRLSQFSSALPQKILDETLLCGFEGVPLCSVLGIAKVLRKVGVGRKHVCQIL